MIRILVTDDDIGDRKAIRRALSKMDVPIDVAEADDVATTLAALDDKVFDCVLIDYNLPGVDGIEAIDAIRRRQPYAGIVLVTGEGDERVAATAIQKGATEYLSKDRSTSEDLRRLISHAIDKKKLQRKIDAQTDALRNFSRVLVHDFKAPLQRIKLLAELAGDAVKSGDLAEAEEMLVRVNGSCHNLLKLVHDLHAYNTSQDPEVEFSGVGLNEAVAEAIEVLRGDVVNIDDFVEVGDLPVIRANGPQVVQLFQNLLGNAVKYCDRDRPVVRVSCAETEIGWRLSVSDNGIGIAEQHVTAVFEPFRRLHSSSKYSGSGLGLATCRTIAERHGARLWCESKLGEGSTFFIEFPRSGGAPAEPEAPQAQVDPVK